MTERQFGPYYTFVRDKLGRGSSDALSHYDIIELKRIDYVKYSDEFISLVNHFKERLLIDGASCLLIGSAIFTIIHRKGDSYESSFHATWKKMLDFIEMDFSSSISSFDLDTAFNAIRLGIESGLDVATLVEMVARYLETVASVARDDIDREDVWSIVINHSDVLTSIYESDNFESASLEMGDAIEKLKVLLGK